MKKATVGWLAIALLGAAALGAYWWLSQRSAEAPSAPIFTAPVPVAAKAPAPPPAPAAEPEIRHPIEAAPEAPSQPEPGHADAALFKALGKVLGKKLVALVVPDELIRHIVATVDNLPRQQLPAAIVPLKRTPGAFATAGSGETLAIAAHNAQRYAPTVKLIAAIDSAKLVALYREFYPLFQRAYAQLGYPKAYFNDRLVEAIDDLLAAPDVEAGARLVQPKVLYEYADPELQARSAGQKIMMRVGPDNAAALKAKLKEIRPLVARAAAAP